MSATLEMPTGNLLSWEDLDTRWKPVGDTPEKRRRVLRDWARRWKLEPLRGTRGDGARFRPLDVINAEALAAGKRV